MILMHGDNLPLLRLNATRLRFLHYKSGRRARSSICVCCHTAQTIDEAEVAVPHRDKSPFLLHRTVDQRLDNGRPARRGTPRDIERITCVSSAGIETRDLKVSVQVARNAPLLVEGWTSAIGCQI